MSGKIRCPGRGNHFHSKLLIFSMLSNKGHLKYYRVPPNHFLIHTHARLSQLPLLPLLSVSELLQLLHFTQKATETQRGKERPQVTQQGQDQTPDFRASQCGDLSCLFPPLSFTPSSFQLFVLPRGAPAALLSPQGNLSLLCHSF